MQSCQQTSKPASETCCWNRPTSTAKITLDRARAHIDYAQHPLDLIGDDMGTDQQNGISVMGIKPGDPCLT